MDTTFDERAHVMLSPRALLLPVAGLVAVVASLVAVPASAQDATGSISGTVEEEVLVVPQPLEGVCVVAFDTNRQHAAARTTTGTDGTYELTDLPPGDYLVAFNQCLEHVAGYAAEWWQDAASIRESSIVNVAPGASADGIDAVLEEAGTVSGTATDASDESALPGICVQAIDLDTGVFGVARTAEDGTYAVADLHEGDYAVLFGDCSDPHTYVSAFYGGFDPETDPEPDTVRVEQGEESADVDAQLVEGGMISGTLTGAHTGAELPDVCVVARQQESRSLGVAFSGWVERMTDPFAPGDHTSGRYALGGVPVGENLVQFGGCSTGHRPEWWEDELDPADARPVDVAPGDVLEGFDAAVQPLPSIERACSFDSGGDATFPDVRTSNAHHEAVRCVADYGIARGRDDGTYGPAEPVRRDQMAAFVTRTLAELEVDLPDDPPDAFSDDGDSTHELAINQLAALDVVDGVGGGRYAPARPVSRGQMASFLVAAYEHATGLDLRATGEWFGDDDGTTHETNIDLAASAGLAAGDTNGRFAPGEDVRRDQMATFLARVLDRAFRDVLFDRFGPRDGSGGAPPATSASTLRSAPFDEDRVARDDDLQLLGRFELHLDAPGR